VENNVPRRLYRILNFPSTNFKHKDQDENERLDEEKETKARLKE